MKHAAHCLTTCILLAFALSAATAQTPEEIPSLLTDRPALALQQDAAPQDLTPQDEDLQQEGSDAKAGTQEEGAQEEGAQEEGAQEEGAQEEGTEEEGTEEEGTEEEGTEEEGDWEEEGTEEEDAEPQMNLDENMCVMCHGSAEVWDETTQHLYVRAEDLTHDIHWKKGILCQECHGGNAESTDLRTAHAIEDGFRKIEKPADEPAFCGYCHADQEKMKSFESDSPITLVEDFLGSVHGEHLQKVGDDTSATCTSCHARHTMRAKGDPESSVAPQALVNTCGHCHDEARQELLMSEHKAVGLKNGAGVAGALSCAACHHEDPHQMRRVDDMKSPVFVPNQVETCGHCHEAAWDEYRISVHGQGLENSGLIKTAVCANCHGAHGILKAEDPASRLNSTNVADTCGACHRFIEDRLKLSVHGTGNGPGGATAQSAPGGTIRRKPSCTDCHVGHDLLDPRSANFRNREPDRCGNCHADLYARYGMSMHGALTNLGYTEGAKCSDCHGAHEILALSDPNSLMAPGNRLKTCSTCHTDMAPNLASFDPHADHHDVKRSALVYWVYRGVLTFIIVVFGFFGIHAICWFLRGLVDVLRHGRPKQLRPNDVGYLRFRPFHRVAHSVMVVSFLGLALTGLPLKFSDYGWAQWLAGLLGGFSSTGVWHRVFSISMFGCFFAYVLLFAREYFVRRRQGKTRREVIFGPDSPLPNLRDAKDLGAMVRWFVGRGPKPTFERWAYWEKFDFFGATSDTILIGVTGLVLWFPNWFCLFLPGEAVNVAKVVHSTLALLATGFVFAIHFFGTHFRPDKFPMDVSVLIGAVSEEEMRHERPELLARLKAEGRLEELQLTIPNRVTLCGARTLGLIALLVGLAALTGIAWSLTQ
ncbi:MAG: cytochrome b/b6 domain-containing protein [Pirellulaceae bacterium]